MQAKFSLFFRFLALVIAIGTCQTVCADENLTQSELLFKLIQQRLVLMEQVALYKYEHELPIYVPEQEQKILENVKAQAIKLGLPVKETKEFVNLQMRLAVLLQNRYHLEWRKNGEYKQEATFDLDTQIRPQLSALTTQILEQVVKAKAELADPELMPLMVSKIEKQIDNPYVSSAQKQELLLSLLELSKR
jgi:chorismate mutase-like protein